MRKKYIIFLAVLTCVIISLYSCAATNSGDKQLTSENTSDTLTSSNLPHETTEHAETWPIMNGKDEYREAAILSLKGFLPDYVFDPNKPTYSYPVEHYKRIESEEMTMVEIVETFGIPLAIGTLAAHEVFWYITCDGYIVRIEYRYDTVYSVKYEMQNSNIG